MSELANKVLPVAPVAGTAAVAAGVLIFGGIILYKKINEEIEIRLARYSDTERREMEAIKELYKEYCYGVEKNDSLTTCNIQYQKSSKNEVDDVHLPIFFQMIQDEKKNLFPVLYKENFEPNIQSSDWRRNLNNRSIIYNKIRDMISLICEYQSRRAGRVFGSGRGYDPTNLALEELKVWLHSLSLAEISENVLKIVEARRNYLLAISAKDVFKASNNSLTRVATINQIRQRLDNDIIPLLKLEISRQSAREHFTNLRQDVGLIIDDVISFIFHIFRNTPNSPQNIILEEIHKPKLDNYKSTVLETISGILLYHLLNSDLLESIFFNTPTDIATVGLEHPYINEIGEICIPSDAKKLMTIEIDKYWYRDKKAGVLEEFAKNDAVMKIFTEMHWLLHRFAMFYFICDVLVSLAGDGGNILVYGGAREVVSECLNSFTKLIMILKSKIKTLYDEAIKFHDTLGTMDQQKVVSDWRTNYSIVFDVKVLLDKHFELIEQHISNINKTSRAVNTEQYREQVKKRLAFLSRLANTFSGKQIGSRSIELATSMLDSPAIMAPLPALSISVPPSSDLKHVMFKPAAASPVEINSQNLRNAQQAEISGDKPRESSRTSVDHQSHAKCLEEVENKQRWIDQQKYKRKVNVLNMPHVTHQGNFFAIVSEALKPLVYEAALLIKECQTLYNSDTKKYNKRIADFIKDQPELAQFLPQQNRDQKGEAKYSSENPNLFFIHGMILTDYFNSKKLNKSIKMAFYNSNLNCLIEDGKANKHKPFKYKDTKSIYLLNDNGTFFLLSTLANALNISVKSNKIAENSDDGSSRTSHDVDQSPRRHTVEAPTHNNSNVNDKDLSTHAKILEYLPEPLPPQSAVKPSANIIERISNSESDTSPNNNLQPNVSLPSATLIKEKDGESNTPENIKEAIQYLSDLKTALEKWSPERAYCTYTIPSTPPGIQDLRKDLVALPSKEDNAIRFLTNIIEKLENYKTSLDPKEECALTFYKDQYSIIFQTFPDLIRKNKVLRHK